MKALSLAALLVVATPVAALAAEPAPTPGPAPAAEVATPKFSADTPIAELMADPRSKAVIEARMPGVEQHPMYEMVKGMSLRQVQPYSEGRITEEMLTEIDKELTAIK